MMDRLLADGGLATTEAGHGEQWDRPNGWAPLQWQAIEGLRNYGGHAIAAQIASRWLQTVPAVSGRENQPVGKYVLPHCDRGGRGGGRGAYPFPCGFGDTERG